MCNQDLCCCGSKKRHNCAEFPRSLKQFLPKMLLRIPISMWKWVYLRGALVNRLKSCPELSESMLLIKGLEKISSCKREGEEGLWHKLIKSNWFQDKSEQCIKITVPRGHWQKLCELGTVLGLDRKANRSCTRARSRLHSTVQHCIELNSCADISHAKVDKGSCNKWKEHGRWKL